jgi:hypothetical protein
LAAFPSLTGYVPYTGATTDVNLGTHRITAQNATIASSGSGDTVTLNHSSGSGNGLNITKGGNGEGLYINKTSGSGNAATIIGTLNATTLVKSGGTSSQFLKADGTVDSSVYVPTSRELTINGVTYDLSANRSWTVSSGISGSGASGQVSYWDGTTSQAGSSTFLWNAASNLLRVNGGIGINRDAFGGRALDITGGGIRMTGSISGNFELNGNNSSFNVSTVGGIAGINISDTNNAIISFIGNSYNYAILSNASSFKIRDITASNADRLHIYTTGNVGINTSSDGGQRLQVQGTTLLNGNVTFSSSTGMTWDATNSRLGIGTNAPSSDLSIIKSSTATVQAYIKNSSTGLVADTRIVIANDASLEGGFFIGSSTRTLDASSVLVYANRQMRFMTNNLISTGGTDAIIFQAGGSNPSQEGMRVTGTKNVLIGSTTDSGERLQVTGTMKVTGAFFAGTGSPTSFYLRNATVSGTSGDIGLGIFNSSTTGTAGFILGQSNTSYGTITKWGSTYAGNYAGTSLALADSFQIQTGSTNNTTLTIQGNPIVLIPGLTSTNVGIRNDTTSVRITTLANVHTSGTALLDLDVSTTARASLRIRSGTAPTSPNDGDIWFDGTDIKMRIGGVTKTFTLI